MEKSNLLFEQNTHTHPHIFSVQYTMLYLLLLCLEKFVFRGLQHIVNDLIIEVLR